MLFESLLSYQPRRSAQCEVAESWRLRADSFILPVITPRGFHPFPSRTRKLRPAGPIVLHAKVCGRVGRRRIKIPKASLSDEIGLLCLEWTLLHATPTRLLPSADLMNAKLLPPNRDPWGR